MKESYEALVQVVEFQNAVSECTSHFFICFLGGCAGLRPTVTLVRPPLLCLTGCKFQRLGDLGCRSGML